MTEGTNDGIEDGWYVGMAEGINDGIVDGG